MLLDRIIEFATDADKPLCSLLRQCVVLGHSLKNEALKNWANQELNGYSDPEKVPEYRVVNAGATGVFNAGYAFPDVTRPLPASLMDKGHRWAAEKVHLAEPVSAYESCLQSPKGHSLSYQWRADMVVYYQSKFMPGHALLQAWQEVPFGAIAGVLDTIRTRVLNIALDIQSEIGESDADLKQVESDHTKAEKVNFIVVNHIYGGTVYQASEQTISSQNIAVGNWQDLKHALLALGIQEGEINNLSEAIDADAKTFGGRVKAWIGCQATKVFDKGLEVGASVGTVMLTEYVKRYLGLS